MAARGATTDSQTRGRRISSGRGTYMTAGSPLSRSSSAHRGQGTTSGPTSTRTFPSAHPLQHVGSGSGSGTETRTAMPRVDSRASLTARASHHRMGGAAHTALTPSFASSSFTVSPSRSYVVQQAPAAALPSPDALARILTACVPTMCDALAKFQYQQAIAVVTREDDASRRLNWRNWDAFGVMVRLVASCESTYHLMRYLTPEMVHTETIDQLYNKLVVLVNHIAEEVQVVLVRAQIKKPSQAHHLQAHGAGNDGGSHRHRPGSGSGSGSGTGMHMDMGMGVDSGTDDSGSYTNEERDEEHGAVGELKYYAELLDQAADFFALRLPMIEMYRGCATLHSPNKYAGLAKMLDRLLERYESLDHPLLVTLKQSAVEELQTVRAAFKSEVCIAQYEFTKSMVELHRLKASLRSWSDQIDAVTEYPHSDESEDSDADHRDDAETPKLGSVAIRTSSSVASSTNSFGIQPGESQLIGRSQSHLLSHIERRRSQTPLGSTDPSSLAATPGTNTTFVPSTDERQNAFSRLLSQRGLLSRRGFSVSSLRYPRDATQHCNTPNNTLEHVILGNTPAVSGSFVGGGITPSGNTLGSALGVGSSGFNTTNSRTLAAEMMASALAKQEREDGYALPLYQWSKRFYRSLVSKFTLYFHHWIEPFEKERDEFTPFDLTRIVRSPVGISYLQLIDVLLAKGPHRPEEGKITVMLVLETDRLENRGVTYYPRGHLCPRSSNPSVSAFGSDQDVDSKMKLGLPTNSMKDNHIQQANQPRSPSEQVSPGRNSGDQHALFLNIEPEAEDEEASDDFLPLWGLRSWPAIFCYPHSEPPMEHWPNLVSLIMDNRPVLEDHSRGLLRHAEKRINTCYCISQVDTAVFLVALMEGKRRPSDKTTQVGTMLCSMWHADRRISCKR